MHGSLLEFTLVLNSVRLTAPGGCVSMDVDIFGTKTVFLKHVL
jgi:hypothetical protein